MGSYLVGDVRIGYFDVSFHQYTPSEGDQLRLVDELAHEPIPEFVDTVNGVND
jgi:hypothetical protein